MATFEHRERCERFRHPAYHRTHQQLFGSTAYFAFAILFIAVWIAINSVFAAPPREHDPPFFWLQGIVSANALLLTIAVLIRQKRMAQLAQHRAHLDLQINRLAEQKVTKLPQLSNEQSKTRVQPGHDTEATELSKPADAEALLQAIKQQHEER